MRGSGDVSFALWGLALFAAWLFVGLPALYSPSHEGFLGVKLAEWLLIGATLALYVATRQLVVGAEKKAERQLRAYVMIEIVRLEGLEVGSCPRAVATVKNSGTTPARNVTHWSKLVFSKFPEMADMAMALPNPKKFPESPIAPGGKIILSSGLDKPIPDAAFLSALTSEQCAFYLIGEIRCEDAFGEKRETDFHLFCNGPAVATGAMSNYSIGNRIT
jgi:hypothetical protein